MNIFAPPDAPAVALNDEVRRIEALPRRSWAATGERLVADLTEILRTPWGKMSLRPIQAVSLAEIGTVGGLFGPQRVGAGKTLTTLLAPECGFAERPLLLVPAALVDKTRRDERILRHHWRLPEFIRIVSYEWLGRAQAAGFLDSYRPDMIIADEAHRLKNPKAAVTRRVRRYMSAFPATKFVALSGTITKRSLHDFAHLMRWCLPPADAPLPRWHNDLETWADALDERKGQVRRAHPGGLKVFCNDEERALWDAGKPRQAARRGFRRRLIETPGVVASHETKIDASLDVRSVEPDIAPAIDAAFKTLRDDCITPDGWPIADGLAMFRHARELALGFFYVWDPRPPKHWLIARQAWAAYVRKVLKHSRTLDSELQVRNAHPDAVECRDWLEVRDVFKPNTVPRWIDDSAVEFCANWAHRNRGIVWVEHRCFGERLAEISGLPYYGRKGLDASGRYIEDHPGKGGLIASIASNGTGRNLQRCHRNLIASMPANGLQTEQLLGRTHRDGQLADAVSVDVIVSCAEHVGAFWQAVRDAEFVRDLNGSPQKLLDACVDFMTPETLALRTGARWEKDL